MQALKYLTLYFWLLPSVLVTAHTLYSASYVSMISKGSRVKPIVGIGLIGLECGGPFSNRIYKKPSSLDIIRYLIIGIIPILSFVVLFIYILQIIVYIWIYIEQRIARWKQ